MKVPNLLSLGVYLRCLAFLILLNLFLPANPAHAMPSNQRVWTFRQPDGTPFKAILVGDEFFAYHKTPDGELILQDSTTGFWHYARPKTDGSLEPTADVVGESAPPKALLNQELPGWTKAVEQIAEVRAGQMIKGFLAHEKTAPNGTVRGILLLANFSDTGATFSQPDFSGLMNTPGYSQHGALGSVRDFYYEASYGALTIQIDVYGWFNLPQTRYYYGHNTGGVPGIDQNPRQMILDAITASNATVNYANYDADGDGWVDFFGVVHQGQGEEQSGAAEDCIWSHRWNLSTPVVVDGKQIQDYHTEPELLYADLSTIGVFCHEMGHVFNLPDLYDTVGSSEGLGAWSLMASGGWCGPAYNGAKPCHFDPWCKMALGWLQPTTIYTQQTGIALPGFDQNAVALRIPVDPYQDGEYFLVCNRHRRSAGAGGGFDEFLPGSGALILHVDDYVPNNDSVARKKVDVEEADGLAQLDNGSNIGNAGDLYPNGAASFADATNPNTREYGGASTGIVMNSFAGEGTADMTCAVTPRVLSGDCLGYDESGVGDRVLGFDGVDYGCVRFTTASGGTLERVKTYFTFTGTTNYVVSVYSGWSGGRPSGLLTSQAGAHTGRGFEEIVLANPQTFAANAEFPVQVRYDTGYLYRFVLPLAEDWTCDSRSYISDDGITFTNLTPSYASPYDLNIRADLRTGPAPADETPPTVSISAAAPNPCNVSPIAVDVAFSEAVTGFQLTDLTLSNASAGGLQVINAAHYRVNLTPVAQGLVVVSIAAGAVQDYAGNASLAGGPLQRVFDSVAPLATLTLQTASPTTADAIVFDVSLSEPLSSALSASDIVLTGGLAAAAGCSVTGGGTAYAVTVTPSDAGADGNIGIALRTGLADAAGNPCGVVPSSLCTVYNWFGFTADPTDASLYEGDTHSLYVAVSCGSGSLIYQWKWEVKQGGSAHDLGGQSACVLEGVTVDQEGEYWCEVTYSGITHVSNKAVITIKPHLVILTPPWGGVKAIGDPHVFSVVAGGGYEPLSYSWRKDGDLLPGQVSSQLILDPLEASDVGVYRVTVLDSLGEQIESAPAVLETVDQVPAAGTPALALLAGGCGLAGILALKRRKFRIS